MADVPDSEKTLAERMRDAPFLKLVDMRIVEVHGQTATIELPVTEKLLQGLGFIHGGVTGALIDTALGAAILGARGGTVPSVSVEFKVNFYRPARLGDTLTAHAEVLHLGRFTAAGHARVSNQSGQLVAHGTGTYMRVQAPEA